MGFFVQIPDIVATYGYLILTKYFPEKIVYYTD